MTINKQCLSMLATLAFILVGCAPAAAPLGTPTAAESRGDEPGGYAELVEDLRAAGAVVEPQGEIDRSFFPVDGRIIQVNDDAEVQVFEFANEAARQQASSLIAEDGSSIGTSMITWVDQPNFWEKDRLIVLYVGRDQAIIELLTGLMGEPLTEPSTTSGDESTAQPGALPEAVQSAVQRLVETQNVAREEVEVVEYEQVEWRDSCLGLADAGEMCMQVITPGWRVVLESGGKQYVYHTDQTGASIRLQSAPAPDKSKPGSPDSGADQSRAVQAAIVKLSDELKLDIGNIEIVSAEETTWSDSCLGLGGPAELCLQALTPGYRVVLQAEGQQYELHTDLNGDQVRLKP